MQRVSLAATEQYTTEKFYRAEICRGERIRTLLLTLLPGQAVPSHRHEGYEVLLQPLRGEAQIVLDNELLSLRAGEIIFVDGANDFAPANRTDENFAMLITLVRK